MMRCPQRVFDEHRWSKEPRGWLWSNINPANDVLYPSDPFTTQCKKLLETETWKHDGVSIKRNLFQGIASFPFCWTKKKDFHQPKVENSPWWWPCFADVPPGIYKMRWWPCHQRRRPGFIGKMFQFQDQKAWLCSMIFLFCKKMSGKR